MNKLCLFSFHRHQLASQKSVFSDISASSAPSPPARERIPPSFQPSFESRERSRNSSPYSSLGSSASTIVANGFASAGSTGSDSNLNRVFPTNGSMRQQLLRRLWHKEYRRLDRTGSLSPPMHRSRTKRGSKVPDTPPDVCLECQRLDETHFNRSVPEMAMKHTKHSTSTKTSSFAFTRKSFSIETETINDRSIMTISSASSEQKTSSSPPSVQSANISNVTNRELDIKNAADMLNQMNGNFAIDDQINGNESSSNNGQNSFLIEMEDDRINITTLATAESSAITESTLRVSSNESQQNQSIESTSQSSHQWHHSANDGNNNNNNDENDSKTKITEIGHMRGGVYDAYHMSSGEINLENESVVRLKTHEPLDQSTIDTIISQILVDSLNNIIVVQGKSQQNETNGDNTMELSLSQTQTESIANADESSSNTSLPLPVTDQVYFPHYLSAETLSEYSTKLSDNSNATDLLPSNLVISVISGSSYPGDAGESIVHRITDIPRTESMEVQPSSAASMNGDDINGNRINEPITQPPTNAEDEDDVNSLVDSLDDPNALANVSDLDNNTPNDVKIIEKSQAFFVPIESSESSFEKVPSPVRNTEYGLKSPISHTMPDRLRERLEKRQIEINERKEAEVKRRQEKIQKLINQHENNKSTSDSKTNSPSFEVIPDESPTNQNESTNHAKVGVKKVKGKQLQSDIGLLESYTVDAKGNLKFIEVNKKTNGTKTVRKVSGPVVKHVAIKKTITTSKPLTNVKKSRDSGISDKIPSEKRMKIAKSTTKYRVKEIASHKTPKDVQKMTLGQHSPSDMITPDRDCGPRRMYQKTEIREGAKRIEILEIVECK